MREEIITKLKKCFAANSDVSMAFLFGSQASGKTTSESDVDIAIWLLKDYELKKIDALWREIESLLHNNVDLIVLNKANPNTAWAAMRGIPLKITDYRLYYGKLVEVSMEAEDMQDFAIDLYKMREKARSEKI